MSAPTRLPAAPPRRAPEWIREKKLDLAALHAVKGVARRHGLSTVCEEARCPNRGECFVRGTATFLLLGDVCTRACGFCDIATGRPAPPDPFEPARLAAAVRDMNLAYVVVTSVDRDDLPDGGAAHFVSTIRALRRLDPPPGIEVLVPDFRGRFDSVRVVVEERPDVFNHNVETVPRLYARARRGAHIDRSLGILAAAKDLAPGLTTKSGLMVGLGETREEVLDLLARLRAAAVDVITIGQYLRPSRENLPVEEYVPPAVFDDYRRAGEAMGFRHVFSGPFVRSSYRAEEALLAAHAARET
ncbi:MAG TPA: lipoyl synthase [Thermoanaerobaculia bacterium]|nr:lipoyl synthase [Thermoanaerobaculia bacterium]